MFLDTATVTGTTPDGTKVTATSNTLTLVACAPCEDKDHGGCKGNHPGGKYPAKYPIGKKPAKRD
ncbi:hypothetical protein [Streptomyces sp. AB3(2024)]|uniref:hypothetical protein n=1 Tax=Streptomyces sp. AB3(2024) TaxID=3317321 RepID=UPI0035A29E9C